MNYELIVKPSAEKQFAALPKQIRERVATAFEKLKTAPRPPGALKMEGDEAYWRIRVGEYRIVYEIEDRQLRILVVRVGHRRKVYRK